MEKVIINSYEDFEKLVGQQIGVSEYVELPQERINLFADATLDHQWIHVDTERAKVESPFKSTIALRGCLPSSHRPRRNCVRRCRRRIRAADSGPSYPFRHYCGCALPEWSGSRRSDPSERLPSCSPAGQQLLRNRCPSV